ncbi:hypothetical protein CEXT_393981 [Caerostris extrusa]|uniref:Uncharacterized protein n=1 Tax=Caerostris extrusa TaxID=172846 RepID=A0AAV4SWP2_CAEEX|nr:hypothetical protein CEXT_393981 [Caerostris extrusa]
MSSFLPLQEKYAPVGRAAFLQPQGIIIRKCILRYICDARWKFLNREEEKQESRNRISSGLYSSLSNVELSSSSGRNMPPVGRAASFPTTWKASLFENAFCDISVTHAANFKQRRREAGISESYFQRVIQFRKKVALLKILWRFSINVYPVILKHQNAKDK